MRRKEQCKLERTAKDGMAALEEEKARAGAIEAVEKDREHVSTTDSQDVADEEARPHLSFKTKMAILVHTLSRTRLFFILD